jgi:N-acetylglutamate synthase-like GNAT family acetyltransferase
MLLPAQIRLLKGDKHHQWAEFPEWACNLKFFIFLILLNPMANKLEKEDIGKLSKFLKTNDKSRKESKIKDISDYLSKGYVSEINFEKHFITKKNKKINASAHVLALKNGESRIRNLTISPETTEKDLFELINGCIDYLKSKNYRKIETTIENSLEKFFKKMNFKKVGEKNNSKSLMSYTFTEEVQSDLKKRFEDEEMVKEISDKTSERLRKLR